MAINPNNSLSPKHVSICAETGGGKGVAVQTLAFNLNYPLVIFDPYDEYASNFAGKKCHRYVSKMNFTKAFAAAWKSGKRFILSYCPRGDKVSELEWFSELVWKAADGKRILNVYFSEFGKCVTTTGTDRSKTAELVTGGRKYGLRCGFDFQRSAEVPKTIWNNTPIKIIGKQGANNDIERVRNETGCSRAEVAEIQTLNDLLSVKNPKIPDDILRVKIHYILSKGLNNYQKVACIVPPNRKLMKNWSAEQKREHKKSDYKLQN